MKTVSRTHADKHAAIVAAALDIFGRDGFADGNVDEIAQRAGVAKPTIYNRFGDKRTLFVEAMKLAMARANERIMGAIRAIDTHPGDLRGELERLGHALAGCMTSDEGSAIVRTQIAEGARFPELQGDNQREQHLDALAGKLAQLNMSGHLALKDPQRAARQFMALVTADALADSGFGSRKLPASALAGPVSDGVDTFLAAFGRVAAT